MPKLVKRGPNYAVEYFDAQKGFTTRKSLKTPDPLVAANLYSEWCLGYHVEMDDGKYSDKTVALASRIVNGGAGLDRTTVAEIVSAFYSQKAINFPSRYVYKSALSYISELLKDVTLEDFGIDRQEEFVEELREEGLADGTIGRLMAAINTSVKHAYIRKKIREKPYILTVTSSASRQRVLTDDEARALIASAVTENQRRFLQLAFLTAARPQAIMDLDKSQFDTERKLLDLNPAGRKQNPKKYRPTIPICQSLLTACNIWTDGAIFVVGKDHKKRKTYRTMTDGLAWPEGCTVYTIRHTVGTELRSQGVPEFDVSAFLGHKPPGVNETTLRYAKWRPEYMTKASEAIQRYWERINDSREVAGDGCSAGPRSEEQPSRRG
jgi:integrase